MIKVITPFTGFKVEPGDGLHRTISRAVYRLCHLTDDDEWIAWVVRESAEQNLKRPLQPNEVENLIMFHRERQENPCLIDTRHKALKNETFTRTIAGKGGGVNELFNLSGRIPHSTEDALERLYSPNDWLYIGKTNSNMACQQVAQWSRLNLRSFSMIMPNPFVETPPARKTEYVKERLFLVYESDEPWMSHDMQANVIMHLRKTMPLRMVVSSGNSSLHAWFDVSTILQHQFDEFEDLCRLLSADPMTLGLNHLVRLPMGTNPKTNQLQDIIYFR